MATKAYFENIQSVLINTLQTAQKSLYIAVAWITDKDIIRILAQKAQQKVRVQVLITDDEINNQTDFSALQEAGGKLWRVGKQQEGQDTLMHNKFCVIDSHTIITGSYNWTWKAQRHFENITITDEDPALASQFMAEFERIKRAFLEIEMLTFVDMPAILQRMEILKRVLTLQDEEDINHQCIKLRKILPHALPTELIAMEQITKTIHKGLYKEALVLVEQYLLDNAHMIVADFEAFSVSVHIKNLERPLTQTDNEVKEIEKIAQNMLKTHKQSIESAIEKLSLKQKTQVELEAHTHEAWWNSLDKIWQNVFYAHACFWKKGILLTPEFISQNKFFHSSAIEIYKRYFGNENMDLPIKEIHHAIDNITVWHLACTDIEDYTQFRKIRKITHLDFSDDSYDEEIYYKDGVEFKGIGKTQRRKNTDYSFLPFLKDLEYLSICWNGANLDCASISRLQKLKMLDASETSLLNISQLSNINSLENLYVTDADDISFLRSLKNIKNLSVPSNVNFSSLSELKKLEGLTIANHIYAYYNNTPSDLSVLKKINYLKKLHIHSNITDFSFFECLTNLTFLSIAMIKIDLSILSNLKNLTELHIDSDITDGDTLDITPLKSLKKLEKIFIFNNRIAKIPLDFLKSLPNLSDLCLESCFVENIPNDVHRIGHGKNCLPQVRAYLEAKEHELPF